MQSRNIDQRKLEKMTIVRSIEMNKEYVKMCKVAIKDMEDNCNPRDRLEAGVALEFVVNHMGISINGWKKWCNLRGMNVITDEEFKELIPKLTKLAIKWIKVDKKITEAKTKELEEELKEFEANTPKTSKENGAKKNYIT